MLVNGWTLFEVDFESDSSLELDELPSLWGFERVLSRELETLGCFGAWNNSSIVDYGLTKSSYFQATDSKMTSLNISNWSFLGLKSRKPFDSSL